MKIGLIVVLSGCTGSHRQGTTAPVFFEAVSPPQLQSNFTNDSPATDMAGNADLEEGVIHSGNTLLVTFTNLLGTMPPFFQPVREDGTITLIYNRVFQAEGKKIGDLEKEIRDYYVPAYVTNLTVTIHISSDTPCIYVDGEFRNPGRYPWTNGMTLNDALEAAGGFTDFANHRIKTGFIIRAGYFDQDS